MRSVFLDFESLDPEDLDITALESLLPEMRRYRATSAEDVVGRIAAAELVIVNKVRLDREVLEQAEYLKLVVVTATGTNNVDLECARERGIRVCNAREYGTASVVQHTFCLMLALANQLVPYVQDVRAGAWSAQENFCLLTHPVTELAGKILGIVGFGALGRGVADLARAWGMEVVVAAIPGRSYPDTGHPARVPLRELLTCADVVSIHCLLSEQTRGLIGDAALTAMKPGALLVNTARGGIVDEAALLRHLENGHLGGAALDVLGTEPPDADHPLLATGLPNLLVTPHCAWASREARQRLFNQVVANIHAFLETGEPLYPVV